MAGPYLPQYDVYYKKLDVDGKGEIGAMEAATFLKKSGLSDEMLGKVIRFFLSRAKGQLISKCPYEKSVSSKIPTKIFLEFCSEIFCSFFRASWKLFGLPPGDLFS